MSELSRRSVLKVLGAGCAAAAAPVAAEARVTPQPDAEDYGLLVDSVRCIGCRACQGKCKQVNGKPPDVRTALGGTYDAPLDLNAQTLTVIKRWANDKEAGFVKAQCMHCVHPSCASVCMMHALHKGAHGVVEYDADKCIGCRNCQIACPFNVPKFEWSKAVTGRIQKCELCRHRYGEGKGPACAEVCPRDAVTFGKRGALLAEARRRIAQRPSAYQPKVYGETDGGGTNVLYLSPVSFQLLGLPALGTESPAELSESVQHGIYQGMAVPAVLLAALGFVSWRNAAKGGEKEETP
jgi:Fe-S-cluster-containing dehydrogenase component